MSDALESTQIVPSEVADVFSNLADFVYNTSDIEQIYAAICTAATQIVPGCDHAAVMQRSDYATVAATSDTARHAQVLECETGQGACVDAIEDEPMQLEADFYNPRRWSQLTTKLLAETPLRGALGFRLLVEHQKTGSLNMFSETRNALGDTAVDRGTVLASFATVAATSAESGNDAEKPSDDGQHDKEIDKAVRLLMVLHGGSEQQAHDKLRRISHDINVKLEDVAAMGTLQGGFGAMASGLNQRDQVRGLFDQHVGGQVAAAAERQQPHLGGEERHAAMVFVDISGSTQMITTQSAPEIVETLNRFFTVIVAEVDRHHGLVNKFEGDAALAVFGAPNHLDSPENAALAAGRAIANRIANEVSECQAGVGVTAGTVVAGNVGSETRYEYTVIGEPVHQASRLCELAKNHPGRLLTSSATLEAADETERAHWQLGDTVTLRGYNQPTQLAAPV